MANAEHLSLINQGVNAWNAWRRENLNIKPDLSQAIFSESSLFRADLRSTDLRGAKLRHARLEEADLRHADVREAELREAILSGADLRGADLSNADLRKANLKEANLRSTNLSGAALRRAYLSEADLRQAKLIGADLRQAKLIGADLSRANLREVNFKETNLRNADLSEARLFETVFTNTDLAEVKGLEIWRHEGPSTIDHRTLKASGPLPLAFLRGVGLPDNLIDYLPSLLNDAIQFYSCFISYSSKDQEFADRLYADLQNKGVRCWFAPHDLPIGAKTWDTIDEAIRLRDKVLLILSENAIASDWVEDDEVSKAFAEERDRKKIILFPIRIDNTVMDTAEPWARKFRDQRNIGDFTRWKDRDSYGKSLERVMRDLKVAEAPTK